MATTITAPVAVTHAGEYDPALTPQSVMGQALPDIVGGCTTTAGQIKVTISNDNAPDVSIFLTAASNLYTSAAKLAYVPNTPGMYKVTVLDVTAGETVTTTIEVFQSAGV